MFEIVKDPWIHGRYIVLKDGKEVASYILCRGYFSSTIDTSRSGPSGSVLDEFGDYDIKRLKKLEQRLLDQI